MARASSKTSIDHDEIRQWAEQRGAKPSQVIGTGDKKGTGIIRLDFPGYSGEGRLAEISWDDWFAKFDESGLALIFQEKTARGQQSNFNKLVKRRGVRVGPVPVADEKALPDAIQLLREQHRICEELFAELEKADRRQQGRLFEELADWLSVHAAIEERIFYPAIKEQQTEDLLRESVEEHLSVKRILADLVDIDASDPQWKAKLHVLQEQVEVHVKEEERELFPGALRIFGKERMAELGTELLAMASDLMLGAPSEELEEQTDAPAPI